VLYVVATFLAGLAARLVLPQLGVEVGGVDSQHPFWRNISFALPAWFAVLLVYWSLARRHPDVYWYTAVSVSLASNVLLWGFLRLAQPALIQRLGTSYVTQAVYQEAIVICLAALLSRRVRFRWSAT
jgi:hypothetical protein